MVKYTQAMLDEARAARHAILTGKSVNKFVDQNGESVQYSATNIAALESYIREMEGYLCGSNFRRAGAIGFVF